MKSLHTFILIDSLSGMDGDVQVPEGWINIDLSHPVRLETYDGTCKVIIYHTSTVTKKVLVPEAHIVWVKLPSIHKMLSFLS